MVKNLTDLYVGVLIEVLEYLFKAPEAALAALDDAQADLSEHSFSISVTRQLLLHVVHYGPEELKEGYQERTQSHRSHVIANQAPEAS